MSEEFKGRYIAVTGGTGALGTAVVSALVERGAVCHVPVFDESELDGFPFRTDDRVLLSTNVDIADEEEARSFYDKVPRLWASINIAGGFDMGPLEKTSLDDFQRMMRINAVTCFLSCRESVRMMRSGGLDGGRIVNVSAGPALRPTGGMSAYSTSKAAVASLTQCLAEETKDEGIWINAVVPAVMDTSANRRAMPDADHDKWPGVDEVAETILYLASPRNVVTTGSLLAVSGRM